MYLQQRADQTLKRTLGTILREWRLFKLLVALDTTAAKEDLLFEGPQHVLPT
jgi:hypothetical protein